MERPSERIPRSSEIKGTGFGFMMLKIKWFKIDSFIQGHLANCVQYWLIKVNVTLYA